jgi:hypothetical protein
MSAARRPPLTTPPLPTPRVRPTSRLIRRTLGVAPRHELLDVDQALEKIGIAAMNQGTGAGPAAPTQSQQAGLPSAGDATGGRRGADLEVLGHGLTRRAMLGKGLGVDLGDLFELRHAEPGPPGPLRSCGAQGLLAAALFK